MKVNIYIVFALLLLPFFSHTLHAVAQAVEVVPFERPNVIAFHLTSEYVDR